ncbi:MAG: DUF5680 domain-containing protein [bacterium]|nr:DUF5680 domain-containing protein [bacterium]
MKFEEKILNLRRQHGFSQEELAEQIGVSRQAIGKWETGLASPDIENLITLSKLFGVTVDRLIKEDDECNKRIQVKKKADDSQIKAFIVRAAKNTYAAKAPESKPCRPNSHDFIYQEGEYLYLDSYVGSEKFSGEEVVWVKEEPIWSMNYSGRVIGEHFSGDFLKEALLLIPEEQPFRGPGTYKKGQYSYHNTLNGDFSWFQGYEEIYYDQTKIYELYFHGGKIE